MPSEKRTEAVLVQHFFQPTVAEREGKQGGMEVPLDQIARAHELVEHPRSRGAWSSQFLRS